MPVEPSAAKPATTQGMPAAAQQASRRGQYLTPNEVADRLLVAPVTVRLWANRGLLPSETTPGGHRRFRVSDVEDFIARRRQAQESASASPARLLVIDDDARYTSYLRMLLEKRAPGLQVESAPDGFTAGLKCQALRPDIVTLDLQMPGMDGFEVCRLLRGMSDSDKPRIVVLSSMLTEENTRRAMEAGANCCVPKGAAVETLLQAIGISPREGASAAPIP